MLHHWVSYRCGSLASLHAGALHLRSKERAQHDGEAAKLRGEEIVCGYPQCEHSEEEHEKYIVVCREQRRCVDDPRCR